MKPTPPGGPLRPPPPNPNPIDTLGTAIGRVLTLSRLSGMEDALRVCETVAKDVPDASQCVSAIRALIQVERRNT